MFDPILEQYLAQLVTTGKSPATQRAARSDLLQFCNWWERTRLRPFDLTQVGERDLRVWKLVRQQDEGAAPATINRGLSTLRRLCAWAVKQRLLSENPTREVPDIPSTPISPVVFQKRREEYKKWECPGIFLSLDGYPKQFSNECSLVCAVTFAHSLYLPLSDHVHCLITL